MKIRRRVEIEIQTCKLAISGKTEFGRCERCGGKTTSIDQAAKTFFINSRQIFNPVESGVIHLSETAEGILLICFASLVNNHK